MSFNKDLFSINLKNKNYNYCIQIMQNEIITILCNRIKEKNPQFVYSTVNSLKVNASKYLSESEQNIAIQFFNLNFSNDSLEYVLYSFMNLYNNLENAEI